MFIPKSTESSGWNKADNIVSNIETEFRKKVSKVHRLNSMMCNGKIKQRTFA